MKRLISICCLFVMTLSAHGVLCCAETLKEIIAGTEMAETHTAKGEIGYRADKATIEEHALSGVVKVFIEAKGKKKPSLGTGFYFASGGLVLTAAHVLENSSSAIIVNSEGELIEASVLAREHGLDLVLLSPEKGGKNYLPLGRSLELKKSDELYAIVWPGFTHVSPRPTTYGELLSFPTAMSFGVVRVDEGRVAVDLARYWKEDRPLIELAIPASPEWSGAPLLDMSGRVVAIWMGTEDKGITFDTPDLYKVDIRLFGSQVPPIVLESTEVPPTEIPEGAPDQMATLWSAWLMNARALQVPVVDIDGQRKRIIHSLEEVESIMSEPEKASAVKARQSKAGVASQQAVKMYLPGWLTRKDPKFPPQITASLRQDPKFKGPALPEAPEGHSYAIPIEQARRVFRTWIKN